MNKLAITIVALIVSASIIVSPLASTHKANAISGSDFKAGRIIDDYIFTNKDTMGVAQIQQFLSAKVPNCEIWHSAYDANNPPPYTCLKDYQENPTNGDNNFGRYVGSTPYQVPGGKSAAQIIWEAGQAYGINPQVLIVLLQKEQALVTDTWPLRSQFTKAMGYLCPDTAPCSSSAGGFYKQVFGAAWQFRHDFNGIDTPNYWSPYGKGWNSVLYNPSTSCGTRNVYIETQATAVLYKYTPYTPNDAALAVMNDNTAGGTVPCGAYGNRNFFWYFTKWFGSTLVPSFSAQLIYQSSYPTISAGQTADVILSYKNTGSVYWRDSRTAASFGQYPINLATANDTNRISWFGASWPSGSRPALTFNKVYDQVPGGVVLAVDQTVVHPGQIAEFSFKFTAATNTPSNVYREAFFPVREGTTSWYMGGLAWLDLTIRPTNFSPVYYRQSPYPSVKAGEVTKAYFDIKNSGNTTWYDDISRPTGINPLRLATYLPINHSDKFSATWATPERPNINFSKVFEADGVTLSSNQHIVSTGQIVRFEYDYTIPVDTKPGLYREFFTPILEGASNWNIGGPMWHDITVLPTSYNPVFIGQSNYPTIAKGASQTAFFKLKNNGNSIWYDSISAPRGIAPMHLATTNPINRSSLFGGAWINPARPAINFAAVYEADGTTLATNQHVAQPGQIIKYEFTLIAPLDIQNGTYREFFMPILEGAPNWNMGILMWLDVSIN